MSVTAFFFFHTVLTLNQHFILKAVQHHKRVIVILTKENCYKTQHYHRIQSLFVLMCLPLWAAKKTCKPVENLLKAEELEKLFFL